jgi:hypothetical protein
MAGGAWWRVSRRGRTPPGSLPCRLFLSALDKPDDKKRIDEQTKKRADIRKLADQAALELRLDLMLIELPPQADDKELVKLLAWLKEIIKKKGIPLGKHVSIAPDASFDIKAKKLKSFGITFTWDK